MSSCARCSRNGFARKATACACPRRAGLALAIYAALKAVVQASGLSSVGLRVGSYLAVGGFLLGVAYWYRAAGEGPNDDDAAPGPTAGPPSGGPAPGDTEPAGARASV